MLVSKVTISIGLLNSKTLTLSNLVLNFGELQSFKMWNVYKCLLFATIQMKEVSTSIIR